ncbi:MAG: arylsulfatase A-like enzyme [Cyclobacteriaceae bacterium]|jgi:arylsulfatase A-like enzyme
MNNLIKATHLCIFCLVILGGCQTQTQTSSTNIPRKQNVVIIFTDDMGYGDISTYGAKQHNTPNIDQLASEGVKLTDFYVPVPYCAPSRATLLTGRFPLRHGLIRNPTPDKGIDNIGLPGNELTIAEVLQDEGYKTKLIGKWHLGHVDEYFPTRHGFDEYYGILYSNDMRPVQMIENMDTVEYPVDQSLLTKRYTERALDFIQQNKDEQFFLHLCHAMPHKPLAASKDFYTPDTPDNIYDDVIRELDWSVGEVMDQLKKLDLLDNTIVIFLSDNGPSWGGSSGGLKGMKGRNWEGGTRVPFIIKSSGLSNGKTITTPSWSPDVFPTILSMLNIEVPENRILDGQNIQEILKGNETDHQPIFTMRGDQVMAVRSGDWKLFLKEPKYYKGEDKKYRIGWDARKPDGTTIIAPIMEQPTPDLYPGVKPLDFKAFPLLFNLKEDQGETVNLAEKHPKKVKELKAVYGEFLRSLDIEEKF